MTGAQQAPKGALATLLLVAFIDMAGFGVIIPFLPFWAEKFGATPDLVTLLMAGYAAMQFLLAPAWGWASDRWGRKPVLLISVLGSVLSFVWLAFASTLWMLFAARILAGAMGANIAVAQAYIADVTPAEGRARGMGLLGAAFGVGFITGPAVGALLAGPDPANPDFQTPFLAGAAVSAVSFLLCLVFLREPPRHRVEAAKGLTPRARLKAFGAVLGHPAVSLPILILALAAFVMGGVEATFALWAERQLAWGPRQTGYFLAYIGVCIALAQGGAVGAMVRRFGEERVAQFGFLSFVLGLGLIPFSETLPLVLLCGFLIAFGVGLVQPALNGLVSRNAPADIQGSVMGATQSAQSLARIFGPAVAGVLFAQFGHHSPYVVGAAISVLALLLSVRVRRLAPAERPEPL